MTFTGDLSQLTQSRGDYDIRVEDDRTGMSIETLKQAFIDNLFYVLGKNIELFILNGAVTIGTLEGANIKIRDEVGAENFFLSGLKADEVMDLKAEGYNPCD